jgi:hypothetical protein
LACPGPQGTAAVLVFGIGHLIGASAAP